MALKRMQIINFHDDELQYDLSVTVSYKGSSPFWKTGGEKKLICI